MGLFDDDKDIARAIRESGREVSEGLQAVAAALRSLAPPVATQLSLKYHLQGGITMGAPVTGNVGQVFNPTVVESNSTTPSIAPIGPLVFASDNTAAAAVDPSTGIVTLVAANADGSPATANISVIDQGNNLTDTVAFTVDGTPPPPPPVATNLTLSYTPAASRRR